MKEKKDAGKSFAELLNNKIIQENLIEKMGFQQATPIQEAVIPPILEQKDVYAGAKTGSGKTIAFVAPMAQMLLEGKIKKALVLSPTRELALQIDEEAMRVLANQTEHVSIPLYGGVPLDQQLRALKSHNCSLYIATPGRMIDFISEGCLPLSDIEVCVLDEADRMCDMGFAPQVMEILSTLPNRKQTLMFSATLPKAANEIMNNFLHDPVQIQIDSPTEMSSTIKQRAIFCDRKDKVSKLRELLNKDDQYSVVFTRTRKNADRIYERLSKEVKGLGILHAGYSMGERERTIRSFKEGKLHHIIATDVAARGLDVESLTQVIHFDLPDNTEDYIHRSGRSGRAGRSGEAYALVDRSSHGEQKLIETLSKSMDIEYVDATQNNRSRRGTGGNKGPSKNSKKSQSPSKPNRSRSGNKKRSDSKQKNEPRKKQASQKQKSPEKPKKLGLLQKTKKLFGLGSKEEKQEPDTKTKKASYHRNSSRPNSKRRRNKRNRSDQSQSRG